MRRRVPADRLYKLPEPKLANHLWIKNYIILNRIETSEKRITVEKITTEKAAVISEKIIQCEFSGFFSKLHCAQINALLAGEKINYAPDEVLNRYRENAQECLQQATVYQLNIPYSLDNETMKNEILKFYREII